MEEEIIIRPNDSASVLDADMTTIQVTFENASETRDNITIHTYSLTAVNILNNRKLDLNSVTRAIRDATCRLTQRPTIVWIPVHTGISGNEYTYQAAKRGLQLDIIHTTVKAIIFRVQTRMKAIIFRVQTRMKVNMAQHYNEQV